MSLNPTFLALLERTQQELPSIARQVLEATSQALQSNPKHFALLDPWSRRKGRFVMEFESELRPVLAQLRQGQTPSRQGGASFEGLSLVDEHQALRDVGIAHVVELCTESSRQELFQLGNFFNALQRGPVFGRDSNALRPALFARALVNALAGADLNAEAHYALVRAAAPGLAGALVPLYQHLAALLHQAKLTPLVSTRAGQEAPRRRDVRDSITGALADWHARTQAVSSRPQALIRSIAPVAADDLLKRLYDRILADPTLSPPVKAQLARLQVAVARLSHSDPSLLNRDDHPTWRLINAVAAYAGGFQNPQDPRLGTFLRFLEEQTQALVDAPNPSSEQFAYLLRLVDAFIARQAKERGEPTQKALAVLEREGQRNNWLRVLREQLAQQIPKDRLSRAAREFLLRSWAEVVVQAMVLEGQASEPARHLVDLVDELIDSLRARPDRTQREQLRQALPALVGHVELGLAGVALSEARRKALMLELMQLHSRVLSGQAQPEDASPASAETITPDEEAVSRFVEERDSSFASVWAHAEVDRASLPTQPLPLQDTTPSQMNAAHIWLDQLQIGGWFHLFVDGGWDTAQLVWISNERSFHLFVSQDGEHRHSMTEGALTQLYLNGLVMYLDQEGLVERAVSTLMQDLDT
jgi:hypothetical protein